MFVKTANNNKSKSNNNVNAKNTNAFIQPKLNVGKPEDKYEVEADKMADQVVAKSKEPSTAFIAPTPNIQKQAEEEVQQKNEPIIQEKPLAENITPVVQLKPIDTIQKQPEEEVQAKEEEVQTKEGEEVQSKEEEKVQAKKEEEIQPKQEEDLQQKSENEPIQLKENETRVLEPNKPLIQKQSEEDVQTKEDEEIQEKEEEEVQTLQMQSSADAGTTSSVENNLNKGGGSPLASNTKSEMESGFGADFGGVRVHNDSNAVQMNKELGSQAFTNGNDVYFNEGKYNPSSDSGKHLLAHELTHTVQQGASSSKNIQKASDEKAVPAGTPTSVVDISSGLNLGQDWLTHLAENDKIAKKGFNISVKIGEKYRGTIQLKRLGKYKEGETQKFELKSSKSNNYLEVSGMQFLSPLKPIMVLNKFGETQQTTGFLSVNGITTNALSITKEINKNLETLGFLGLGTIKFADNLENEYKSSGLTFKANGLTVGVDGYLEATGSMGISDSAFTFDITANVDVAGLASGEFNMSRGEDGKLSGKADISADIANINANIIIEYDKGAVLIQGTGKIESEKFSGSITLLVTDKARSKQMMNAALGVEALDPTAPVAEAAPKSKGNQVLAGWGEVTANITPWLAGNAKVGIDSEGHVTIVGEITVPDQIELMEQRGKKADLFKVEIRAGYGIPLVGQVFLFASIGMFINAGFGPLVLKDIGFTGTYSTDPNVLQEFNITGTLGINAFAIIGLEAEAGVGLTLLGHDIKAGVNVTAAAGIKAYAEATPTLQYSEKASPEGGKVGESRLKGHFEAAAQLFLQLSGALFYELDSPWWSPAPDGREESPLGEVQYPIGDSMGIGADMDWLIGSNEAPELTFSPVEFDADKFTADVMADPPPKKSGKSDAEPKGDFKMEGGDNSKEKDPKITGDGKGLPDTGKKKEDLKKLPDEQKYMRALDEMSKLEKSKPKASYGVVDAKSKKVKTKYGLDKIQLKNKKDDSVDIYVKHKKQDNGKHMVTIPLMSNAERIKLLYDAMLDFRKRETSAAGETGKLSQEEAKGLVTTWLKAHPIVESAKVVDGKETWDYFMDVGDKSNTEKGKVKKETVETVDGDLKKGDGEIGEIVKFNVDGDNHKIWVRINGNAIEIMVASIQMSIEEKLKTWKANLNTLSKTDKAKATSLIATAETLYNSTKTKAIKANKEQNEATADPTNATASQEAITADDAVETAEHKLKTTMGDLFKVFGEGEVDFDASLVESFFTNNEGKKKRIYLELKGEKLVLMLEDKNPKTYREFLDGFDFEGHKDPDSAKLEREKAEPILLKIEALEKTKAKDGATKDEKKDFSKAKAKLIDDQAELLVPITKILFERTSDIPKTSTPKYGQMSGAPATISSSMIVEILTSKGDDGSIPTTAAHKVYDALNKRRNGGTSYYVKGHMLNHNVHGLGKYFNLTPLSVSGNKAHLLNAENTVKIAASVGSILKYEVKIGGGTYNSGIPSKAEMEAAEIPEEKHQALKDVREMEKFVPKQLIVSLYTLREDGESGNFTKEKDVYKNKTILNPVETNLKDYQIGEGEKTKKIVLANDSLEDIVDMTKLIPSNLKTIISIIKKDNLKQFRSIESSINNDNSLSDIKDDLLDTLKSLKKLHENNQLKINESND